MSWQSIAALNWSAMATVTVLTIVSTYPFYAVVTELSTLPADKFEPCNGDGCLFIRFFSSNALESTQVYNLDPSQPSVITPAYALIINGQNATWSKYHWRDLSTNPVGLIYAGYACLYLYPMAYKNYRDTWLSRIGHGLRSPLVRSKSMFSDLAHGAGRGDGTRSQEVCQSEKVKSNLQNHLSEDASKSFYVLGVVAWGALKILHDVALLSRGATGISEVCYYQLGGLSSVLALGTPGLLLCMATAKMEALALSVMYGDYLYAISYDVPLRVVEATAAKNPTRPLLLPGIAGAKSIKEAPLHTLSLEGFRRIADSLHRASTLLRFALYGVLLPIIAGPVFVRLLVITAPPHDYGLDILGVIKALLAGGSLILPATFFLQNCRKFMRLVFDPCSRTVRMTVVAILGSLLVGTLAVATVWTLIPVFDMPVKELLTHSWKCTACGFGLCCMALFGVQTATESPLHALVAYYSSLEVAKGAVKIKHSKARLERARQVVTEASDANEPSSATPLIISKEQRELAKRMPEFRESMSNKLQHAYATDILDKYPEWHLQALNTPGSFAGEARLEKKIQEKLAEGRQRIYPLELMEEVYMDRPPSPHCHTLPI